MNVNYDEVALLYPAPPTNFPTVWHNSAVDMIPPRFAIWFPVTKQYQVYDIIRNNDLSITLKPTKTSRDNPFYFAIQNYGDRQSRTVTLHNPRAPINTHTDVPIWFTGAWLCKKSSNNSLQAVLPILCSSHTKPFKFVENIGMYPNYEFINWTERFTPTYTQDMTHNRMVFSSLKPIVIEEKSNVPIPQFVASALLQQAIQKEECCPISMENLMAENAAVTSCYHIFERKSLYSWLEINTSCPICKQTCVPTDV